jgi:hypothetical protein
MLILGNRLINEEESGMSEWLMPEMKGYKMACCDCGLVHDIDFKVIRVKKIKDFADGSSSYQRVYKRGKLQVMLRAGRNNRATGQLRRKKHKIEVKNEKV